MVVEVTVTAAAATAAATAAVAEVDTRPACTIANVLPVVAYYIKDSYNKP